MDCAMPICDGLEARERKRTQAEAHAFPTTSAGVPPLAVKSPIALPFVWLPLAVVALMPPFASFSPSCPSYSPAVDPPHPGPREEPGPPSVPHSGAHSPCLGRGPRGVSARGNGRFPVRPAAAAPPADARTRMRPASSARSACPRLRGWLDWDGQRRISWRESASHAHAVASWVTPCPQLTVHRNTWSQHEAADYVSARGRARHVAEGQKIGLTCR